MAEKPEWPDYIQQALEGISILDPEVAADYVGNFSQRWGGLGLGALSRALHETESEDRLFVLLALGHLPASQVRALLVPFLHSSVALERWASAISLGRMHEQEALPVLCAMLTEFLPARLEEFLVHANSPYEYWRDWAPLLLETLGESAAVPALRRALFLLVRLIGQGAITEEDAAVFGRVRPDPRDMTASDFDRLLEIMGSLGPKTTYNWVDDSDISASLPIWVLGRRQSEMPANTHQIELRWYGAALQNLIGYQDQIIFTLGRLGALGALSGLQAAHPLLNVWMVHLLMGYIHDHYSRADVFPTMSPALEADLKQRLLQCFGLTLEEREQALAVYSLTKLGVILGQYDSQEHELEQGKHGS